jgi:hypothetical protein
VHSSPLTFLVASAIGLSSVTVSSERSHSSMPDTSTTLQFAGTPTTETDAGMHVYRCTMRMFNMLRTNTLVCVCMTWFTKWRVGRFDHWPKIVDKIKNGRS